MSPTPSSVAEQLEPDASDLHAQIRRLIEAGQVDEARRVVREELDRGENARNLGGFPELLFLPQAERRPATGRDDLPENMAWLRRHRDEYRGEWVALSDGMLVDHDRSRAVLAKRLARTCVGADVLCVKAAE